MKVDGYSLKNAIKRREAARTAAAASLMTSLHNTEGPSTEELMEAIEKCERDIARLQAFQTRYNLSVVISFSSENISMAEAVKRVGGLERVAAHWRNLLATSSAEASSDQTRSDLMLEKSNQVAVQTSTLRGRMSSANLTLVDIPELEEELMR